MFTPSTFIKLNYEFFRFYGPKTFRFKIIIDDNFGIPLDSRNLSEYLFNKLKIGSSFKFTGFKPLIPSIFFIMNTYCIFNPFKVTNNYIGVSLNLDVDINRVVISFNYEGTIDNALDIYSSEKKWISKIDFSIMLYLNL